MPDLSCPDTANHRANPVAFCIGCGCDDFHACLDERTDEPCHWLRLDRVMARGVCSACPADTQRWDAGDRTVKVPGIG